MAFRPYPTKGVKQQVDVLYLVHVVGAGGSPFDGGNRVHPDGPGRNIGENPAKCLGRP